MAKVVVSCATLLALYSTGCGNLTPKKSTAQATTGAADQNAAEAPKISPAPLTLPALPPAIPSPVAPIPGPAPAGPAISGPAPAPSPLPGPTAGPQPPSAQDVLAILMEQLKVGLASISGSEERRKDEAKLENEFLTALGSGNFYAIDNLKQRYLRIVVDPQTLGKTAKANARMGFLSLWQYLERWRYPLSDLQNPENEPGKLVDDCQKYFLEASKLDSNNPIYAGFSADCTLLKGMKSNNPGMVQEGGLKAKSAIEQLSEFNLFTVAYALAAGPAEVQTPVGAKPNPMLETAIRMMYKNLSVCFNQTVGPDNLDLTPVVNSIIGNDEIMRSIRSGNQKYCINSSVAPHNFEGFFLVMGDMILKSKTPASRDLALIAYNNASAAHHLLSETSEDYKTWPFKDVLEARKEVLTKGTEKDKSEMIEAIRFVPPPEKPGDALIESVLSNFRSNKFHFVYYSEHACMVCHQSTPTAK